MTELADGKLILDRPAEAVARLGIAQPRQAQRARPRDPRRDRRARWPMLDDGIETRCVIITGIGRECSPPATTSATSPTRSLPRRPSASWRIRSAARSRRSSASRSPRSAAINGHALGGGLELAVTCDLRVAAARLKLGMPPGKLGLIYSHTGLADVPRLGRARAHARAVLHRSQHHRRAGGADRPRARTCRGTKSRAYAVELAAEIAGNAPLSLKGNKRIITDLLTFPRLSETLEREVDRATSILVPDEDFREGVRAFGEKRKPDWQGR